MRTHGVFDSRVHPQALRVSLKAALQGSLDFLGLALDDHDLAGHPLRWFHPRTVPSAPRVLRHRIGRFLRRRAAVARLAYRIHNRHLLRFLWWRLGPLMGWLAEHLLVDWGE